MRAQEAKIAVYGAGAMGTVLGALLAKSGLQVDLITRNRAHVAALRKNGATVACAAEGRSFCVPVQALEPKETGDYDVVFLMTKQRQNAEIVAFLKAHLRADGLICTLQNGLPEPSVAAVIGADYTYGAVASFGANFLGEGRVALTSKIDAMRVQVGAYGKGEKLSLLEEILRAAGNAAGNPRFAERTENLLGARWAKLAVNGAFSGLSVVTGLTFGQIAKKRKTRGVALAALRECLCVARASGVELDGEQGKKIEKWLGGEGAFRRFVAYTVLPFAMRKHKKLTSGMLKDVREGRRCEIDFIDGAIVKEGKRLGVPTPTSERIVEIVHGIEDGLYEITPKNVAFFRGVAADSGETL